MSTKKKHINKLKIALVRVLTLFSIFFVLWLSFFWAEQKYTFNKPTLLINGTSILSHTYYTDYLINSIEIGNAKLIPNKILEELYKHPYIEAARLSYRYPDKIIIEISERAPFAIVNNDPMIMLDKECFILPNIENINNYNIPILSRYNTDPGLYPIGKQALSVKIKDTISWLKALNERYPDLYHNISEITLANDDEIILILAEYPTKIMLGNENTLYKIELLKRFEETLKKKKEITDYAYLDMRYNNQVIVKE